MDADVAKLVELSTRIDIAYDLLLTGSVVAHPTLDGRGQGQLSVVLDTLKDLSHSLADILGTESGIVPL